ncbi:peptidoglycan D,D-transpeptidase FtsI family protein [Thiohalorhabdus sp. Cl-TMA]|uniref:Peptidoglycan D,D-transpeptidase FtsI n=1 Tax=Thiohalorhabdus methylotrophus TaxID=3242694 RepID=A0ABV4TXZ9_9GAMM
MKLAWRGRFAFLLLLLGLLGISAQLIRMQVVRAPALQEEARRQAVHHVRVPAIRGAILDRNGSPLAVSTPVKSIYAVPAEVAMGEDALGRLARVLDLEPRALRKRLERDGPFVYLKRQVPPQVARTVDALGISGIGALQEYRRYYPAGEVAAHVVGFAGVDGNGLEGVELAYDRTLSGEPGKRLVERDALGRDMRTLRVEESVQRGKNLFLSIDNRLQYVTYQALKEGVARYQAKAGMAVVVDPHTGEVVALANVPSYNPNSLDGSGPSQRRNRAVTDAMEPGSIFKPFTVAAALEKGKVRPETEVYCEEGLMRVSGHQLHDTHPIGRVTVRQVIQKSSNIGAAKIALKQDNEQLWRQLRDFGFGLQPGTGFPGETRGILHMPHQWQRFDRATIGFGHGVATSALQVARAYSVLANGGVRLPLTLRRVEDSEAVPGKRVLSRETARQIGRMLNMVVSPEGTGGRAALERYRVAGKTGTAQKPGGEGYLEGKYLASFAGFAPVNDPRLVAVVMIDEPKGEHYGGLVAAPVFRRIMAQGLRLNQVPPLPREERRHFPVPMRQARGQEGESAVAGQPS